MWYANMMTRTAYLSCHFFIIEGRNCFYMSCWIQTKSWPEVKEAIDEANGVAIVPIGSVEQHSTHLPVGTDSYVAITLAECAKRQTFSLPPHCGLAGVLIIWYAPAQ